MLSAHASPSLCPVLTWELGSFPSSSLGLSGSLLWGQSHTRNFTEGSRRADSVLSPAFTELGKLQLGLCGTPSDVETGLPQSL